jgi:hypothetical protein
MLPQYFKLHVVNNTGVTIEFSTDGVNNTFTIDGLGWKIVNGALVYDTEQEVFADPSSDLADGSSLEASAAVNNSSDLFFGMDCLATLVTDAVCAGTFEIYYEHSTDGGTTYPSDATDFDPEQDLTLVATMDMNNGAETRSVNFSIE